MSVWDSYDFLANILLLLSVGILYLVSELALFLKQKFLERKAEDAGLDRKEKAEEASMRLYIFLYTIQGSIGVYADDEDEAYTFSKQILEKVHIDARDDDENFDHFEIHHNDDLYLKYGPHEPERKEPHWSEGVYEDDDEE